MARVTTIPHPYAIPHVTRTHVLGVPIDLVVPELLPKVLSEIADKAQVDGGLQIVFVRTLDILRALRDPSYKETLDHAALVLPVSREISRALQKLRRPLPFRYFPTDTLVRVLGWLEEKQGGIYFLGASGKEITTIEQRIRRTFPGCRIVGRYMGWFSKSTEENVCMAIKKSNPLLLVTGPGLVGKDKWLYRRVDRLNKGIQVHSEDFFQYIIGKASRVNKVSFRKGREVYRDMQLAPWKLGLGLGVLWFRFRILVNRAFGAR